MPSDKYNRLERRLKRCIYFNGVQNETCKAGIAYTLFKGKIPCFERNEVICDKLHLPTKEEAEAEIDEMDRASEKTLNAVKATHEDAIKKGLRKGHGGYGTLPCPTGCGGMLEYSVSSYNGHIHGRCKTPHCVQWME